VGPACADLQFSGQDDCFDLRQALVTQLTRADIGGGYSQGIGSKSQVLTAALPITSQLGQLLGFLLSWGWAGPAWQSAAAPGSSSGMAWMDRVLFCKLGSSRPPKTPFAVAGTALKVAQVRRFIWGGSPKWNENNDSG